MCEDGCIIGLWLDEYDELIDYETLKETSKESIYSMLDYTDLRKNTNLLHFYYCPYCGKEIPWNKYHKELKEK